MPLDLNFALAVAANLVVVGVAWGTLNARVKALEKEVSALSDLQVSVTRIETRQDGLIEQVKDLNSSLRWIRDPAPRKGG